MQHRKDFFLVFANELFFRSGAFGVYYLFMNLFQSGWSFFQNDGHLVFLAVSLAQTGIIAWRNVKGLSRVFLSLAAPLTYTVVESFEGWNFILNTAHVFVWVFSLAAVTAVFFEERYASGWQEKLFGNILIALNVSAFLFAYMYEEVRIGFSESGAAVSVGLSSLRIDTFFSAFPSFIVDPTHEYLFFGAIIMAAAIIAEKNMLLNLKNRINGLFGSYIDEDLRDGLLSGSVTASERAEIAVLFADVRGFTALSEHRDAQEVMDMLNVYYQHWFEVSKRYGGIIDKYIGDGIMIWWRLDGNEGANRATRCGMEMLERMPSVATDLIARNLPPIEKIGIGISVGEAIIGNVGHDKRRDYTCIGDTVNTASRLESLSKEYKTDMVIGKSAYDSLSDGMRQSFIGRGGAMVKGREQEVEIFSLKEELAIAF